MYQRPLPPMPPLPPLPLMPPLPSTHPPLPRQYMDPTPARPMTNPSLPAYAEYLEQDVVTHELKTGSLLQGKLRINSLYLDQAYITVEDVHLDVLVQGNRNLNRAMNGDLVAVRLCAIAEWKPLDDESDRQRIATEPPSNAAYADVDMDVLHSL
ncbi:unnamed protein product [Phytophthora lilii]|uniref:Unnamed protein product n=1 Tax=Phytophthora lilii TaxID=2077276 RepID=A0A9W6XS24_9STRA|nr:unnamed protein product [Phytophthora lilii]